MTRLLAWAALCTAAFGQSEAPLPTVVVDRDDMVITQSCVLQIDAEARLFDDEGDGVIQIRGENLEVRFAEGAVLRGIDIDADPDRRRGLGIHIEGTSEVRLVGARIEGFRNGVFAHATNALSIEDLHCDRLYTARLKSTPAAEVAGDWLWPHENDANQWLERYGAAVWIERSQAPTLAGVHVRGSQNGIILSRVDDGKIYDCDASFLSGWGLALWRSSRNLISRNAFDFCVRGYSHGIYNRGQDSAGILMFEQCSDNAFLENSATHGGDGVFGFGGSAALGQTEPLGCNRNVFRGNDFSYAVAHGLELTFSFGNLVSGNRFVDNAICGIWGGYSQGFYIDGNHFEGNGDAGYGLERGAINIEHGADNVITGNSFRRNRCGVHLWEDDDEALRKKPWVKAHHRGSADNEIVGNRFQADEVGVHLRSASSTRVGANSFEAVGRQIVSEGGSKIDQQATAAPQPERTVPQAIGKRRPVGARKTLAGRANIVMTEWGPWDHAAPLIRRLPAPSGVHQYTIAGWPEGLTWTPPTAPLRATLGPGFRPGNRRLRITSSAPGLHSYDLTLQAGERTARVRGRILNTTWEVVTFPWSVDPREDLAAFRTAADGEQALRFDASTLDLAYGMKGPGSLTALRTRRPAWDRNDRFGTVATTSLPLGAGRYRIRTTSDDGVRVTVDDTVVIDNWTWHAPTEDRGSFTLPEARTISIRVEHFELDGFATLKLDLEPES